MTPRWLMMLVFLSLASLPALSWADCGWYEDRRSPVKKFWCDALGNRPVCDPIVSPDLIKWATVEGGAAGSWERCGTLAPVPLQDAQEVGTVGGFTHLPETRPFMIWPEFDTLGAAAPRLEHYGDSGAIVRRCVFGSAPTEPCEPETVHIPVDRTFRLTYEGVSPPSELEAGTLVNTNGVVTGTGIFARTECQILTNVDATDDNRVFASFNTPITAKQVWCSREATSAPTLAPTFQLVGMMHGAVACGAPTAAATPQAITAGGTVTAYTPVLTSVTNIPNPATATYLLCLAY